MKKLLRRIGVRALKGWHWLLDWPPLDTFCTRYSWAFAVRSWVVFGYLLIYASWHFRPQTPGATLGDWLSWVRMCCRAWQHAQQVVLA